MRVLFSSENFKLKVTIVYTMNLKVSLISLVFFLFLISGARAYTNYNSNGELSDNYNGFSIIDHSIMTYVGVEYTGECYTLEHSTNYYSGGGGNYSGYLQLTPQGPNALYPCNFTDYSINSTDIYITALSDGSSYIDSENGPCDLGNCSAARMLLPKDHEGLVALRMLFNETTGANIDYSNTYLYWFDSLGANNRSYFSSFANNTWLYNSLYIQSDKSRDRYITVYLKISFNAPSTAPKILIDKFKVYTYDIVEMRDSFFTSYDDELLRYCGGDNSSFRVPFYPTYNQGFIKRNASLNLGLFIANSTEDPRIACCVFQSGNITIARKCTRDTQNDTYYNNLIMRDLVLVSGNGLTYSDSMLIKAISTTGIKYDFYTYGSLCQNGTVKILFNGVGNLSWTVYTDTPRFCGADYVDRELSFSGLNLSGTKFRNKYGGTGDNPAWIPFFIFNSAVDNAGQYCDPVINEQYYILPNGSIQIGSNTSCGSWGCNAANTACDFGSIGQFCSADNVSYTTVSVDGSISYNACYPENCYQLTASDVCYTDLCIVNGTNTIVCAATEEAALEARTGAISAGSVNYWALTVAGYLGVTDITTSIAIFSIVISLAVGFFALFLARKNQHGPMVFVLATVGVLFICTIAFQNIWLVGILVILAVISAAILSKGLGKTLGLGGGG